MPLNDLCTYLPGDISREIKACIDSLTEVRIRAGKPVQLVCMDSVRFLGESIGAQELRKLAVRMMDHSYYACEQELSQGFFTMANGCRVGVGGSFIQTNDRPGALRSIGSLCIRIARAVPDCAIPLLKEITADGKLHSTLILSRPGMGKTTMLRDTARLLSSMGYMIGIADERHEIAACRSGIPTMDVGLSTDVVDGCPKSQAMEHLIRSMSPQIIITDEIGNRSDIEAIREAMRKGVTLIASAHAGSFEEFETGVLSHLASERLFSLAVLLAEKPGRIAALRTYNKGSI